MATYHLYYCGSAKRLKGEKKKTFPDFIVRKDSRHGLAERLGLIKWHHPWRQYVFHPDPGTVWSGDCLLDVVYFLRKINEEGRRTR